MVVALKTSAVDGRKVGRVAGVLSGLRRFIPMHRKLEKKEITPTSTGLGMKTMERNRVNEFTSPMRFAVNAK